MDCGPICKNRGVQKKYFSNFKVHTNLLGILPKFKL